MKIPQELIEAYKFLPLPNDVIDIILTKKTEMENTPLHNELVNYKRATYIHTYYDLYYSGCYGYEKLYSYNNTKRYSTMIHRYCYNFIIAMHIEDKFQKKMIQADFHAMNLIQNSNTDTYNYGTTNRMKNYLKTNQIKGYSNKSKTQLRELCMSF